MTYMLFMKMLDDAQKTKEANANIMGVAVKDPTFREGMWHNPDIDKDVPYETLRWRVFKKKEAEALYRSSRRDAFAFIKNLNTGKESAYSRFMANATFMIQNPRTLVKIVEGIDALDAGMEFYRKAKAMEGALPKKVFRLLKFGKMESGTVCNAISDHTHMEGSLRAFQDEIFYAMRASLVSIGKEVERRTGCTVSIYMNDGYPPGMNPGKLYDKVKSVIDFEELAEPSMITEDFSWYQKTLPGVFFFLGIGDTPALHADNFDFDEKILVQGADFFEKLAEEFQ